MGISDKMNEGRMEYLDCNEAIININHKTRDFGVFSEKDITNYKQIACWNVRFWYLRPYNWTLPRRICVVMK